MVEILSTVIGSITLIGVALASWLSQRATRERRLLLRVQKLGNAYALMPDSVEKATFESHLNGAVANLNQWLDPVNTARRKLIRTINRGTYAFSFIVALIVFASINANDNPWASSVVGASIGIFIAVVTSASSYLIERSDRKKAAEAEKERERVAASLRKAAFVRGEPLS